MSARRSLIRASVAAALLLGASGAARRHDDPLAGRTPGETRTCLTPGHIYDGPEVLDNHTIAYRDGPRLWVTHPTGACPALRPLSTLILLEYGGQICEHDRFRVRNFNEVVPSNFCFFGKWTAYEKPKR